MKKLNVVFAGFLLIAVMVSCDKKQVESKFDPVFTYDGTAIALPGNTSCEDVGYYPQSSGKVDYVDGNFVFEYPETGWPFGLVVNVTDGRYVSFALPENSEFCVGAVIVKGGASSNVYTYDPGVKFDIELSAPLNASGLPAGLSNLTFCFVECPKDALYAVVKFHYWVDGDPIAKLGKSGGEYIYNTGGWCESWMLGVSKYPSTFPLHEVSSENVIGMAYVNNGVVTLDLNNGLTLDYSYLFVGTMDQLLAYSVEPFGCPDYSNWLFNDEDGNTQTFTPGL